MSVFLPNDSTHTIAPLSDSTSILAVAKTVPAESNIMQYDLTAQMCFGFYLHNIENLCAAANMPYNENLKQYLPGTISYIV